MADEIPTLRGLRLVASMVGRRPMPFTISVVGSILFAAGTVGTTVVLGRVIDDVVLPEFETSGGTSTGTLWAGVLAVLLVAVVRALAVVARRYFAGMTAAGVRQSIRDELADRYVVLPLSWYREMPTGRLLAHVDADTEVAADVIHPLPFSVGSSSLAVFALISAVAVDPVLAGIGLIVFPIMIVLNRWYSRFVEAPAARVQSAVGDVSAIAHESFDGALVVKTLGRADEESARFAVAVDHLKRERVTLGYVRSAFHATIESLPQLGIVAITVAGVYRLEAGAITTGELVQFVALFSVLAFPMQVFGFFLESIPPSVVAHDRITGVLDSPVPELPTSSAATENGAAQLQAEAISVRYPDDSEVLRGIDFEIDAGETVAIVGSTGSGKSTLVGVLAGLDPATSGTVWLDGVPLNELAPDVRTRHIAYVSQEPFLFADSVRHNIDLTGELSLGQVRWAASIAQADDFIIELPEGYDTVLGERGVTVSGGQRQRIALARALASHPRLLLLDDATSAVDSRVEQRILEGLDRELEMTLVVVAQRLSTIELADRVLFLRDGYVHADGRHAALLADEGYSSLVTAYGRAAR